MVVDHNIDLQTLFHKLIDNRLMDFTHHLPLCDVSVWQESFLGSLRDPDAYLVL